MLFIFYIYLVLYPLRGLAVDITEVVTKFEVYSDFYIYNYNTTRVIPCALLIVSILLTSSLYIGILIDVSTVCAAVLSFLYRPPQVYRYMFPHVSDM